ncbi:MAG: sulfatase-like hydrolase/transferase, partial [Candidatus Krumholzibacteria bacterium]|nr:sulfatase-like hydrolase/transferase [Candidatus Krumholzibacteria bacterium]
MLSMASVVVVAVAVYLLYSRLTKPLTQDSGKRYNVVIIVSDALRQDVVGCYGGVARTPNIDWLASNGIRFENSYSTSPWTSPSAVSIFTGNYATSYAYSREGRSKKNPVSTKTEDLYVPQIYVPHSEYLLAESLKDLDYVTGMQNENVNASLHNNLQGLDSIPQHEPSKQTADRINEISGGGLSDSWNESKAYWDSFYFLRHLLDI